MLFVPALAISPLIFLYFMGFYPSGDDLQLAKHLLQPYNGPNFALPVAFFGRKNNIWTHIYTVYSSLNLAATFGVMLWCNGRCYRFSQQLKERFNKGESGVTGRNRAQEANSQMHWILLSQVGFSPL